jgi:hypothetical protein
VAAWLLPAVATAVAAVTHVQVAPVVLGAVVWIAVRRVLPARGRVRHEELSGGLPQPG